MHTTVQPQLIPNNHFLKVNLSYQFPCHHCTTQMKQNVLVSNFWFMHCQFECHPNSDLRLTPDNVTTALEKFGQDTKQAGAFNKLWGSEKLQKLMSILDLH